MNFDIENEFRQDLGNDEKLLWSGRPKTGIRFRSSDILMIPVSILWFGFAIFWEYSVLRLGVTFMALFGLPFIIMGLYMFIGRFFFDALKRKNTSYGITDNRIIIRSGIFSKELKSLNIRTISDLSFKEMPDGSGTITMGPTDFRYYMFSGMSYWPGAKLPPSLEFIDDVKKVYNIILQQQRK